MSGTTDIIRASLKLDNFQEGRTYTSVSELIKALPHLFTIEIPFELNTLIVSEVEPGDDYKEGIWIKRNAAGDFDGLYVFDSGAWESVIPGYGGLLVSTSLIELQAIDETLLNTSVAGEGLSGGGGNPLDVNVDGATIVINLDTLYVPDGGITENQLNTSVAGAGLNGGGGAPLSVDVDGGNMRTVGVPPNVVVGVKPSGIGVGEIDASIAGAGLSGGSGVALAVNVDSDTINIVGDALEANFGNSTNFTPVWSCDGGMTFTVDPTITAAKYQLIGDVVYFTVTCHSGTLAAPADPNLYFTLPFALAGSTGAGACILREGDGTWGTGLYEIAGGKVRIKKTDQTNFGLGNSFNLYITGRAEPS